MVAPTSDLYISLENKQCSHILSISVYDEMISETSKNIFKLKISYCFKCTIDFLQKERREENIGKIMISPTYRPTYDNASKNRKRLPVLDSL